MKNKIEYLNSKDLINKFIRCRRLLFITMKKYFVFFKIDMIGENNVFLFSLLGLVKTKTLERKKISEKIKREKKF